MSEISELQDVYVPMGNTERHIRRISIGMIIGPTCVGKSTLIKSVTDIDPEFSNPGGFTTRQLRPADTKTYRQMDNDPQTLYNFLDSLKKGEPVQYNVYDTGDIYGSEVQDYPTLYSVLDTQYKAVGNLRRAGFKSAVPIGVVTHPNQYIRQLRQRFGDNLESTDAQTRLVEAVNSLEWLLEQEKKVSWVINRSGRIESAAHEVIGLVRGYYKPLTSAQSIGEKLLKKVRELN